MFIFFFSPNRTNCACVLQKQIKHSYLTRHSSRVQILKLNQILSSQACVAEKKMELSWIKKWRVYQIRYQPSVLELTTKHQDLGLEFMELKFKKRNSVLFHHPSKGVVGLYFYRMILSVWVCMFVLMSDLTVSPTHTACTGGMDRSTQTHTLHRTLRSQLHKNTDV